MLEYFDRVGFTRRAGNERIIRRPAAEVFAAARRDVMQTFERFRTVLAIPASTEEDRLPVGRAGFNPLRRASACLVGSTPTLFRQNFPSGTAV